MVGQNIDKDVTKQATDSDIINKTAGFLYNYGDAALGGVMFS